jgi:hypothetical protein
VRKTRGDAADARREARARPPARKRRAAAAAQRGRRRDRRVSTEEGDLGRGTRSS